MERTGDHTEEFHDFRGQIVIKHAGVLLCNPLSTTEGDMLGRQGLVEELGTERGAGISGVKHKTEAGRSEKKKLIDLQNTQKMGNKVVGGVHRA